MPETQKPMQEPRPRRFRRYPEYKDSGVEWLGEIPAHWDVTRTKFAARLRSGHTPSRHEPEYWQDCTIPWFGLADVWQIRDGHAEYVTETSEKISELGLANSAARLLPKGTVMLSRTASVGFSAIMGVEMATTQDFVNWVCGPTLLPEYLLYVFRSMQHEFRRLTMGSTHQTIYMPDVGRFCTPLPPIPEQEEVVAFVRRHVGKIDALVAKKERLVELLQEKRTALITRAVTKGLDPSVPMKDSGIEWLGEIPAHWEVKRLRHISPSLGVGVVVNPSNYVADEGLPFLYGSDISEGQIHATGARRISRQDSRRLPKSELRPGDLVMVRVGAPGVTAVVPPDLDGANCASLLVIRRSHGLASSWLCYALNSRYVRLQIEAVQYGAAQEQFNVSHAVNFVIALPPQREQDSIADYLDRETAKIDTLVAKVREAIDRLRELRTAIISAAVTGKIDVRGAVG